MAGIPLETLFSIASMFAMLGWVLLIFLPRWQWVTKVTGWIIPASLALLYSVLVLTHIATSEGGFSSLAEVKLLFSQDHVLLAGWIHYLVFDMVVGTWIAREADKIGLHRLLQAPILFFTFMFGPLGFFIFAMTKFGLSLFAKNKN